AAAAADPAEQRRLVPHADLPQLDARAERARQVADQLAEVHAPLRREVDEQLVAVELPLRIAHLHLQAVPLHLLARDAPDARLVGAQRAGALEVLPRRAPQHAAVRRRRRAARHAARALALGDRARRRDAAQVLAPVRLHDHVPVRPDLEVRDVVALATALEADFYDLAHDGLLASH